MLPYVQDRDWRRNKTIALTTLCAKICAILFGSSDCQEAEEKEVWSNNAYDSLSGGFLRLNGRDASLEITLEAGTSRYWIQSAARSPSSRTANQRCVFSNLLVLGYGKVPG